MNPNNATHLLTNPEQYVIMIEKISRGLSVESLSN